MAYFLKKTKTKHDVYLQIYESFYDPERKGAAHRSIRPLGYVKKLMNQGIQDPFVYFQAEIDRMNAELKEQKQRAKVQQIAEETPERFLGYFPLKNIQDGLHVKKWLDLMQSVGNFRFNLYELISHLIYARVVMPCSKRKTWEEVFPRLMEGASFGLSQIYDGLEFIGQEYEKIIEIYNQQVQAQYPLDTSCTYFDCTNFFFEIDRADDFRRKGPSKENRKDPIVGLGLLLDANQIPCGMRMYPGNESEKPVLRSVIKELKVRHKVCGRTIQVADKGLNCADNIFQAKKDGDGYIFTKSVKRLSEKEKKWVLLLEDYKAVKDAKGNALYWYKECIDEFPYEYTDKAGKKVKVKLTEKRLITFNPQWAKKKLYEINRQVEKARGLRAGQAKREEYGDSAKYVLFQPTGSDGLAVEGKVQVVLNQEAIENDRKLAGFNLIVTSETQLSAADLYATYHNLWRIEESFRVMKSQLDARPVYLQKEDTIKGHFLICYLAVLLLRLFQFKVLENQFGTDEILQFMKQFRIVKISDYKYVNLSRSSEFTSALSKKADLPLTLYNLSLSDVKKVLNHRF